MHRWPWRILTASALLLAACASAPERPAEACLVASAVLAPIVSGTIEDGGKVFLSETTRLDPPAASREHWQIVAALGFNPPTFPPGVERELFNAYSRNLHRFERQGLAPAEIERRAWEAAYEEAGDMRIRVSPALWREFLNTNRRGRPLGCRAVLPRDADLVRMPGLALPEDAGPRDVAIELSAPAFDAAGERALIAGVTRRTGVRAEGVRETGTVWLVVRRGEGWRVLSARRTDPQAEE